MTLTTWLFHMNFHEILSDKLEPIFTLNFGMPNRVLSKI